MRGTHPGPDIKTANLLPIALAAVAFLGGAAPILADDMQSSAHRLRGLVIGPPDSILSATGLNLINLAGGDGAAGPMITAAHTLQLGIPGDPGARMSEVLLTADQASGMPASVDLAWTGSDLPFRVYRSEDCAAVMNPQSVIASVSGGSYTDLSPPAVPLLCYNVRGTPPAVP